MESLVKFVRQVTWELEKESVRKSYIGFHDFPLGACMDASILLGVLLNKNGFGDFQLVSALNDNNGFLWHAWLENDWYLIDITVDQFTVEPRNSQVIEIDKMSEFYYDFKIQFKDPVLKHKNVPCPGFHLAMSIVVDNLNSINDN